MKKLVSLFMTLALMLCIPVGAGAVSQSQPTDSQTQVIWYENGAYAEITTQVFDEIAEARATTSSKQAATTYTYYDESGAKALTFTLHADFSYDHSTSKATKAYGTYSIKKSGWSLSDSDVYCSGDTAYGDATFSGPNDYAYPSLQISCDPDGNIST